MTHDKLHVMNEFMKKKTNAISAKLVQLCLKETGRYGKKQDETGKDLKKREEIGINGKKRKEMVIIQKVSTYYPKISKKYPRLSKKYPKIIPKEYKKFP